MTTNINPFLPQDNNPSDQRSERIGIVAKYSGIVTRDQNFHINNDETLAPKTASYLRVGGAGDIVALMANGTYSYIANAQVAELIPGTFIKVASGPVTIEGVARSTTATNLSWWGGQ